jgi:branched-chain amino acid transport system ATP-binding protein
LDMEILKVDKLQQAYGGLQVLNGCSLSIEAGEKVALIGPNGAGKTTLLNVLNGLIPPKSGRIYFLGHEITHLPTQARTKLGMARSFQITSLFSPLDILINVLVALHGTQRSSYDMLRSIDASQALLDEAQELLDSVGLWQKRKMNCMKISYGEQRSLELCLALASKPKILLLDEPSAGLSKEESTKLGKTMRGSAHKDVALLLVAHDIDLVFQVADRILVMNQGTIFAEGTAEEIQMNREVAEVYFGPGVKFA